MIHLRPYNFHIIQLLIQILYKHLDKFNTKLDEIIIHAINKNNTNSYNMEKIHAINNINVQQQQQYAKKYMQSTT